MKELSKHAALGRHGAKKRWSSTSPDERAKIMRIVRRAKEGRTSPFTVQTERRELRKQNADPNKVFAKRREEHAEALAAR